MTERIPILFDTDIGSDIDDAVALAYLLREPRCELVGVTTVTGDTAKRSALVEIVRRAAGRDDVPVHRGAERVLLHGPGQPDVPQYDAVASRPHTLDRPPDTAVAFLRDTIRARPGEITLLTVGPLTNVALLFSLDPEIPSLLGGFVSMAGWFNNHKPEWNATVDPLATAIAFRHPGPGHLSVGLDVTLQCRLPADDVRSRFTVPPLDVVAEMAEVWFARRSHITFHDPLAAVAVFEPDLLKTATGHVEVGFDGRTTSPRARGGTASPRTSTSNGSSTATFRLRLTGPVLRSNREASAQRQALRDRRRRHSR